MTSVENPCRNCGMTLNGYSGTRSFGFYSTHMEADCIRNLRQRADKAEADALPGWRSMGSAPKDGTPVDLWVINDTGGERYTDMVYCEGDADQGNDWVDIHGMFSIVGDGLMRMDWVVAWMPTPDAPIETRGPE